MSMYLPEDWVRWRIDRAIDQAKAELFKSRDDYDAAEGMRAVQVLHRLQDDIEDGPVRTERQIFEDYRGPVVYEENRPRVHAHWIHDIRDGLPRCSACSGRPHNAAYGAGEDGFCGFCGAQMDEPPE